MEPSNPQSGEAPRTQPTSSLQRRRRVWILVVGLALPLLVGALELRLPKMTRPIWEDEVHHNEIVLAAHSIAEFDDSGMYRSQMQPKLDFAMRKLVWFPLFGVNERAMRLPALVWGLALVLFVYGSLIVFLRELLALRLAVILAAVGSLWIVRHPMEVLYATEGRHYSLIAFASTVWFSLLLMFGGKPRWLFGAASLLFANTHFFALPLIAGGYGLQLLRELRCRAYRWIPFHALICWLVYECMVRFNAAPLEALFSEPPGATVAPHVALWQLFQLPNLEAGLALWLDYARALAVPPATWAIWLVMLGDAIWHRRARWLATLAALFVFVPSLFAYMKFRSSYPFGVRYFSAFFGLGLVAVAAGFDVALLRWQALAARLPEARRAPTGALAVIALAVLFSAPRFAYDLVADTGALHRVPKNFSPYFRAYSEIVDDQRSAFVVHTHCYANDIPAMYFYFMVRAARPEWPHNLWLYWGDAIACDEPLASLKGKLRDFMAAHVAQGGVIVLDDKERDCGSRLAPVVLGPVTVERFRSVSACMWKVSGVSTLDQLARIAELVQFSAARNLR
jgi:hypothetical protein